MIAAIVIAASSALAQRRPPPASWTELECFGYSPADDAYACVDFELVSDDEGARGVAKVRDVLRWSQRGRAAWGGRRGAALVRRDSRAEGTTSLAIAERAYDVDAPLRRLRSAARVRAEVARAGYDRPVDTRIELAPGAWRAIAGVELRFETRSHEGDASAYAIGHVLLRCAPASTTEIDLLREWPRGERAIAFHAQGAPSIAIALLESGGGEGAGHVATRTLVVDPREACAD